MDTELKTAIILLKEGIARQKLAIRSGASIAAQQWSESNPTELLLLDQERLRHQAASSGVDAVVHALSIVVKEWARGTPLEAVAAEHDAAMQDHAKADATFAVALANNQYDGEMDRAVLAGITAWGRIEAARVVLFDAVVSL